MIVKNLEERKRKNMVKKKGEFMVKFIFAGIILYLSNFIA